jgi:hypothetical protein
MLMHARSTPPPVSDDHLLGRIRAEYREMPGLRLTLPQAARLWQLDLAHCEVLLAALVEHRSLVRMADGSFVMREAH